MLAHLRFPLCSKQLTEYKKQSGVKGCMVACFIAEGRVKAFKVHSFISENIFCKATAHRIWNMMPFATSPSGTTRKKKKKKNRRKSPTGFGIEAARKILFFSEKAQTFEPKLFCRLILNHGGSGNYEISCKFYPFIKQPFTFDKHWVMLSPPIKLSWFEAGFLEIWMYFLYIQNSALILTNVWVSQFCTCERHDFRIWDKWYPDYAARGTMKENA